MATVERSGDARRKVNEPTAGQLPVDWVPLVGTVMDPDEPAPIAEELAELGSRAQGARGRIDAVVGQLADFDHLWSEA